MKSKNTNSHKEMKSPFFTMNGKEVFLVWNWLER